jgi:Protein of unknown function (DUF664)
VPDLKPPRALGDDRDVLLVLLNYQRESLVRKVIGVDEESARHSPVASGTTLLWLVRHLDYAERLWIVHRFAGGEQPTPVTSSGDTVDVAVAAYRATWAVVDAAIAATPNLNQLSAIPDDRRHSSSSWSAAALQQPARQSPQCPPWTAWARLCCPA